MMKIKSVVCFAACLFAAVSCLKETVLESCTETMTVEASSELGTKTTLDGVSVLWTAGDKISVLYGSENKEFTTADSGAEASFTGAAAPDAGQEVWAVYPYSKSNALLGKDSIRVTIPELQYAREGTFAEGANVTAGRVTGGKVTMYNVGGLVRISITGADITSVSIRARYDAANTVVPVAGVFDVVFSDGVPIAKAWNTSNIVKLLPPSGSEVFTPGDYYIAVAAVSMANGFEMIYTKAAARGVKVASSACAVQRAHLLPVTVRDAGIIWTGGRFIDVIASDEDRKAVQPFTVNLPTGGSKPSGGAAATGTYYLKGEYAYPFRFESDSVFGYFLTSGYGRNGFLAYSASGHPAKFVLPAFAHKRLAFVELYSSVSGSTSDRSQLVGKSTSVSLYRKSDGEAVVNAEKIPWNGSCWVVTTVTPNQAWGMSYGEIAMPDREENVEYYFQGQQIRKMRLFYAGEDVEEVVSVRLTSTPSKIAYGSTGEVSGSFSAWNFGQKAAAYTAGMDYRYSRGTQWTTIPASVTGNTFSATIPSTFDIDSYVCRAWVGVDGENGDRVYSPEFTFEVTGTITAKTLVYNFLEGDPSTWDASSTEAKWPFDAAFTPSNDTARRGHKVSFTDVPGNEFTADYTYVNHVDSGYVFYDKMYRGRGWQVRNMYKINPGETHVFEDWFQLHLPKFPTLRLTKVSIYTHYSSDPITVVDSLGTVVTGGSKKSPTTKKTVTWTLSGTSVNTSYRLKTIPKGSWTNTESSARSQGYLFEPAQITLVYEK